MQLYRLAVRQRVKGVRGGAGGWGTTLQAARSRVRFLLPHYGPGVYSASNRNEYKRYLLGCKWVRYIGLTTLSCADYLDFWDPQSPGAQKGLSTHVMG
jgi:hypothetical protein